ncbi:MAG: hypothetical protein ACTHMZ_14410, partial [Actinomycetes bacterium]
MSTQEQGQRLPPAGSASGPASAADVPIGTAASTEAPGPVVAKMSVPTLTGMVVGSMVGAGVFSLPARFGVATG